MPTASSAGRRATPPAARRRSDGPRPPARRPRGGCAGRAPRRARAAGTSPTTVCDCLGTNSAGSAYGLPSLDPATWAVGVRVHPDRRPRVHVVRHGRAEHVLVRQPVDVRDVRRGALLHLDRVAGAAHAAAASVVVAPHGRLPERRVDLGDARPGRDPIGVCLDGPGLRDDRERGREALQRGAGRPGRSKPLGSAAPAAPTRADLMRVLRMSIVLTPLSESSPRGAAATMGRRDRPFPAPLRHCHPRLTGRSSVLQTACVKPPRGF